MGEGYDSLDRGRWDGDATKIAEIFSKYFKKYDCLRYGEGAKAPIKQRALVGFQGLFQDLERLLQCLLHTMLQANLNYAM